jgi:hypothetical protein
MLRKQILVSLAILVLGASASLAVPTPNGTSATLPIPCLDPEAGTLTASCFQLFIHIPSMTGTRFDTTNLTADVNIRARVPAGNAVGAVIFFTGDYSDYFYDNPGSQPAVGPTFTALRTAGYKTFEVQWLDSAGNAADPGWVSGMEGLGPEVATSGAREIIEWIKINDAPNIGLCATGNSSGGVQIAYAVAAHGADAFLKSVVYSAGPSIVDIAAGCFQPTYDNGISSGTQQLTPGFHIDIHRSTNIDAIMGWTDPANNCGTDLSHPDVTSIYNNPATWGSALVSYGPAAAPRNYSPVTRQFFVEAELDPSAATVQASKYYRAVQGFKGLTVFSKYDQLYPTDYIQHLVYATATGAQLIRAILLDPANCQLP